MVKFKVGDYVKVVNGDKIRYLGSVGYVVDINPELLYEYTVLVNDKERCFKESELDGISKASIGYSIPCPTKHFETVQQGISKISIGDQPAMIIPSNTPMKVKSSGGSSSYYFSKLPKEVIDEIVEKGGIELKDVVKYCFYNDADVKDITKAIKRIMEDLRGGGKEGVDAQYDLNKIKFFFNEFEKSVLIQKREQELSYDQ